MSLFLDRKVAEICTDAISALVKSRIIVKKADGKYAWADEYAKVGERVEEALKNGTIITKHSLGEEEWPNSILYSALYIIHDYNALYFSAPGAGGGGEIAELFRRLYLVFSDKIYAGESTTAVTVILPHSVRHALCITVCLLFSKIRSTVEVSEMNIILGEIYSIKNLGDLLNITKIDFFDVFPVETAEKQRAILLRFRNTINKWDYTWEDAAPFDAAANEFSAILHQAPEPEPEPAPAPAPEPPLADEKEEEKENIVKNPEEAKEIHPTTEVKLTGESLFPAPTFIKVGLIDMKRKQTFDQVPTKVKPRRGIDPDDDDPGDDDPPVEPPASDPAPAPAPAPAPVETGPAPAPAPAPAPMADEAPNSTRGFFDIAKEAYYINEFDKMGGVFMSSIRHTIHTDIEKMFITKLYKHRNMGELVAWLGYSPLAYQVLYNPKAKENTEDDFYFTVINVFIFNEEGYRHNYHVKKGSDPVLVSSENGEYNKYEYEKWMYMMTLKSQLAYVEDSHDIVCEVLIQLIDYWFEKSAEAPDVDKWKHIVTGCHFTNQMLEVVVQSSAETEIVISQKTKDNELIDVKLTQRQFEDKFHEKSNPKYKQMGESIYRILTEGTLKIFNYKAGIDGKGTYTFDKGKVTVVNYVERLCYAMNALIDDYLNAFSVDIGLKVDISVMLKRHRLEDITFHMNKKEVLGAVLDTAVVMTIASLNAALRSSKLDRAAIEKATRINFLRPMYLWCRHIFNATPEQLEMNRVVYNLKAGEAPRYSVLLDFTRINFAIYTPDKLTEDLRNIIPEYRKSTRKEIDQSLNRYSTVVEKKQGNMYVPVASKQSTYTLPWRKGPASAPAPQARPAPAPAPQAPIVNVKENIDVAFAHDEAAGGAEEEDVSPQQPAPGRLVGPDEDFSTAPLAGMTHPTGSVFAAFTAVASASAYPMASEYYKHLNVTQRRYEQARLAVSSSPSDAKGDGYDYVDDRIAEFAATWNVEGIETLRKRLINRELDPDTVEDIIAATSAREPNSQTNLMVENAIANAPVLQLPTAEGGVVTFPDDSFFDEISAINPYGDSFPAPADVINE